MAVTLFQFKQKTGKLTSCCPLSFLEQDSANNGKTVKIHGDGGWGTAPRTVIAQRKDGVIMFLSIDGENYINGASLQDVIDTLELYGAYNAANLDGGTSATMIVEGKLINNPAGGAKKTNGRYVVTGWGLVP